MAAYTILRTKRKTVALHVRDGGLTVKAPLKMPKKEIERFVLSKKKWITEKLKEAAEQRICRENFSLTYGSSVVYRGGRYPIFAKDGSAIGFDGRRFFMPPDLTSRQIKSACITVYRALAKRDIEKMAFDFAKRMSLTPAAVKISGAKTRWGSCSAKKSLNFSWRLIMAEGDAIEYVVVHELAHIAEMNHSDRFWAVVEGVLPDFRERKAKLKRLLRHLTCEDWDDEDKASDCFKNLQNKVELSEC